MVNTRCGKCLPTLTSSYPPPPPRPPPVWAPHHPFPLQASSLSDRFVHLCNHSVQKEQEPGVPVARSRSKAKLPLLPSCTERPPWEGGAGVLGGQGGCPGGVGIEGGEECCNGRRADDEALPTGSKGNMWTADQFRRYLRDRFQVMMIVCCLTVVFERWMPLVWNSNGSKGRH